MAVLLLDSTIWLAAKDEGDEAHAACKAVATTVNHDLAGLDLTLYETANVAVTKWHNSLAATEIGAAIHAGVGERLMRMDATLHANAVALAATHGLTVYDAAYVAVSDATGHTLVSLDSDLLAPGFATHPREIVATPGPEGPTHRV